MDIRDEEIVRLKRENKKLKELLRGALERISELERRLDLNSSNSSKPPSSDGLKRPHRIKSERVSSGKQSGVQKGHDGKTLEMSQLPHYIKVYQVKECDGCGKNLELVASKKNKV